MIRALITKLYGCVINFSLNVWPYDWAITKVGKKRRGKRKIAPFLYNQRDNFSQQSFKGDYSNE